MIKIGVFPFPYYHKEKQVYAAKNSPKTKMLRNLSIAWISSVVLFLFLLIGLLVPADPSKLPEPTELATTQTSSLDATDNADQETANLSETNPNADVTPSSGTSSATSNANQDIMFGIIISEAADVAYDRSDYQSGWSVGTGCDLRARILQSTSLIPVTTSSNGCTVIYGSWIDPYTGETLTGNPYRGDGTANDLDIDHIIPLAYVNSHGGADWTNTEKKSYGQSLDGYKNGVYVAVSSSENRRKSDSGPSEYYPPNVSYRCEYATKWRDIARIYDISLDQADYDVIKSILIECNAV